MLWVVVFGRSAIVVVATGPDIGQQWFDSFLVAFPDDTPIVKARIYGDSAAQCFELSTFI